MGFRGIVPALPRPKSESVSAGGFVAVSLFPVVFLFLVSFEDVQKQVNVLVVATKTYKENTFHVLEMKVESLAGARVAAPCP